MCDVKKRCDTRGSNHVKANVKVYTIPSIIEQTKVPIYFPNEKQEQFYTFKSELTPAKPSKKKSTKKSFCAWIAACNAKISSHPSFELQQRLLPRQAQRDLEYRDDKDEADTELRQRRTRTATKTRTKIETGI